MILSVAAAIVLAALIAIVWPALMKSEVFHASHPGRSSK